VARECCWRKQVDKNLLPDQQRFRQRRVGIARNRLGDDRWQRLCQDEIEFGPQHDLVGTKLLVRDGSNRSAQELPEDDAGTTVPGLAPSGSTDVILSATGQDGQDIMFLGEDMQVKSVTVNGENTGTPVEVLATGGHTLTVVDAAAITTESTAPAATFSAPVAFAAATATVTECG
jgi:hypothetical protein